MQVEQQRIAFGGWICDGVHFQMERQRHAVARMAGSATGPPRLSKHHWKTASAAFIDIAAAEDSRRNIPHMLLPGRAARLETISRFESKLQRRATLRVRGVWRRRQRNR